MKTETIYKNFKISANYQGNKSASWDANNTNYHLITVTNLNNKKKTRFDFWNGRICGALRNENDLLDAFYCFLSDAECGTYNLNDFFKELYSGTDDISAVMKAHKACKNAYKKVMRILDNDEDMFYDLLNSLNEVLSEVC